MNRSVSRVFSLVVCTLAVACGGNLGRVPDGTATPQTVIHPGGGPTGALLLKLPTGLAGTTSDPGAVYKADAPGQGTRQLLFDIPLALDPDPTYCVMWHSLLDCTVKVVANQTTTYTLGAVHVTFDNNMISADSGSFLTGNIDTSDGKTRAASAITAGATYPVFPGSYTATFAPPSGYPNGIALPAPSSVTVAQGQVVEWPLTIPEWRFRIHIVVPTSRVYPDVPSGEPGRYQLTMPNGGTMHINSQNDATLRLPAASAGTFGYTLFIMYVPLTIPAGAPGTQVDIPIQRIDVDDVAYTKPDGTPATVGGTWSVTRRGGAPGPLVDKVVTSGYSTRTGVDVFAGTYDGTVTYNLGDLGGQKTDTFNLVF